MLSHEVLENEQPRGCAGRAQLRIPQSFFVPGFARHRIPPQLVFLALGCAPKRIRNIYERIARDVVLFRF